MYGEIWSERLAHLQYWLMLIGIGGFTFVLTAVGLLQGSAWRNGETVYRVLPEIFPFYIERAALGCFIVTGAAIQVYNYVRTAQAHRQRSERALYAVDDTAIALRREAEVAGD